jgi:3,4-dihydroxy 2-butanone 4-phosphate synthase/GTP cyclohydrolase II
MARLPQLIEFKKKHRMRMVSIRQLIEYRHSREKLVEKICSYSVKLPQGSFELHSFRSLLDNSLHFALTLGTMGPDPTLVRVQSQNLLQDVFQIQQASKNGTAINTALSAIAKKGCGAFVYITQPMGGLQLTASGTDSTSTSVENTKMDFRGYGIGAQILAALGLRKICLLSSSNRRHIALDGYGLEIVEQK